MIKCPHCETAVDETARTQCPICFTPLSAQPTIPMQPTVPTPGSSSSTQSYGAPARVSLTGEEYSTSAPAAPPQTPSGYAPGVVPSQVRPPVRPTAQRPYAGREKAQDRSAGNGLLTKIAIYFVLILSLAGGGWWFWTHRTNPKGQVQHYLHATQWLDWGVVWDLSSPPPGSKTRHEFVTTMNDKFEDNPLFKIAARHKYEKMTFDVGEPSYKGDEATVNVSVSGAPYKRDTIALRLHNFGGVWKVEPPADNPLETIGAEPTKAEKEAMERDLDQAIKNLPAPGSR